METDKSESQSGPEADFRADSIIRANAEFYRELAAKYDDYEPCVTGDGLQGLSDRDLDRIATLLTSRDRPIECLDCSAGSGNLSLKMLQKGWSVTVVDVSGEMPAILRQKAGARGFRVSIFQDSISNFFANCSRTFDVATFNSVLHYLYLPVVKEASERIHAAGIFYSNFDPIISRHCSPRALFAALDTPLGKVACDEADLVPGVLRRLWKLVRRQDATHCRAVLTAGDLAEYHAGTGVNGSDIVQLLKKEGLTIHDHARWTGGRTAFMRPLNRRLRWMEAFKVIAQKGGV